MAGAEAAARDAEVAGEGGEAGDRPSALPAVRAFMELPPRTIMAGRVVAYRRARATICAAGMPVISAAREGE